MLEAASREIHEVAAEEERRRQEARRLPLLIGALDEVLFELEELNLQAADVVPPDCRRRAAELIAEASRLEMAPTVPATVAELMDRVYEAQDAALTRRRRAHLGLDEPAVRRPA